MASGASCWSSRCHRGVATEGGGWSVRISITAWAALLLRSSGKLRGGTGGGNIAGGLRGGTGGGNIAGGLRGGTSGGNIAGGLRCNLE